MNIHEMTDRISPDPVNYGKIDSAFDNIAYSILDDNIDEIQCANNIKETYYNLTNDEQNILNNKLRSIKYGNRQLNTMLKDYLNLNTRDKDYEHQ